MFKNRTSSMIKSSGLGMKKWSNICWTLLACLPAKPARLWEDWEDDEPSENIGLVMAQRVTRFRHPIPHSVSDSNFFFSSRHNYQEPPLLIQMPLHTSFDVEPVIKCQFLVGHAIGSGSLRHARSLPTVADLSIGKPRADVKIQIPDL